RSGEELRTALQGKLRQIATPRVAKHRVFVWLSPDTVVTDAVVTFARDDDYFFGVLHSRAHELWSLRLGTWLGVGNDPRYTPTTTFETFPFPWPPGQEPAGDPCVAAIAAAARRLVELRDGWLNPAGATAAELKQRTLTNLYNARPAWLANAHAALDRAVLAAYGWPPDLSDDDLLARLLALNAERAGQASATAPAGP
ncbi:MAG: type IIL restriction-modification enzyme MmeI, partial [Thermomicrobiales bacterium]